MRTHPLRALSLFWRALLAASLFFPACTPVPAQTAPPASAPSFEVATIKPIPQDGRPTKGFVGFQIHPDSMEFAWQSLPDLLCYAYGYKSLRFEGQIAGLPDWAISQRYDLVAKMTPDNASALNKLSQDEQDRRRQQMMRTLLADRFSLTLHRGTKQIPVYDLVVAKDGLKTKDAATEPAPPQLGEDAEGKPTRGIRWLKDTSIVQAYSMPSFADLLAMPAAQAGRPVVDKTGLTGTYNFTFDWSVYSASAAATGEATSIFTALNKIGLKLQPSTGAFPTIVVDSVGSVFTLPPCKSSTSRVGDGIYSKRCSF